MATNYFSHLSRSWVSTFKQPNNKFGLDYQESFDSKNALTLNQIDDISKQNHQQTIEVCENEIMTISSAEQYQSLGDAHGVVTQSENDPASSTKEPTIDKSISDQDHDDLEDDSKCDDNGEICEEMHQVIVDHSLEMPRKGRLRKTLSQEEIEQALPSMKMHLNIQSTVHEEEVVEENVNAVNAQSQLDTTSDLEDPNFDSKGPVEHEIQKEFDAKLQCTSEDSIEMEDDSKCDDNGEICEEMHQVIVDHSLEMPRKGRLRKTLSQEEIEQALPSMKMHLNIQSTVHEEEVVEENVNAVNAQSQLDTTSDLEDPNFDSKGPVEHEIQKEFDAKLQCTSEDSIEMEDDSKCDDNGEICEEMHQVIVDHSLEMPRKGRLRKTLSQEEIEQALPSMKMHLNIQSTVHEEEVVEENVNAVNAQSQLDTTSDLEDPNFDSKGPVEHEIQKEFDAKLQCTSEDSIEMEDDSKCDDNGEICEEMHQVIVDHSLEMPRKGRLRKTLSQEEIEQALPSMKMHLNIQSTVHEEEVVEENVNAVNAQSQLDTTSDLEDPNFDSKGPVEHEIQKEFDVKLQCKSEDSIEMENQVDCNAESYVPKDSSDKFNSFTSIVSNDQELEEEHCDKEHNENLSFRSQSSESIQIPTKVDCENKGPELEDFLAINDEPSLVTENSYNSETSDKQSSSENIDFNQYFPHKDPTKRRNSTNLSTPDDSTFLQIVHSEKPDTTINLANPDSNMSNFISPITELKSSNPQTQNEYSNSSEIPLLFHNSIPTVTDFGMYPTDSEIYNQLQPQFSTELSPPYPNDELSETDTKYPISLGFDMLNIAESKVTETPKEQSSFLLSHDKDNSLDVYPFLLGFDKLKSGISDPSNRGTSDFKHSQNGSSSDSIDIKLAERTKKPYTSNTAYLKTEEKRKAPNSDVDSRSTSNYSKGAITRPRLSRDRSKNIESVNSGKRTDSKLKYKSRKSNLIYRTHHKYSQPHDSEVMTRFDPPITKYTNHTSLNNENYKNDKTRRMPTSNSDIFRSPRTNLETIDLSRPINPYSAIGDNSSENLYSDFKIQTLDISNRNPRESHEPNYGYNLNSQISPFSPITSVYDTKMIDKKQDTLNDRNNNATSVLPFCTTCRRNHSNIEDLRPLNIVNRKNNSNLQKATTMKENEAAGQYQVFNDRSNQTERDNYLLSTKISLKENYINSNLSHLTNNSAISSNFSAINPATFSRKNFLTPNNNFVYQTNYSSRIETMPNSYCKALYTIAAQPILTSRSSDRFHSSLEYEDDRFCDYRVYCRGKLIHNP